MKTIFIVDDSATILLSISSILSKAGYTVEKAANAEEALKRFKAGAKVDLLLTDLNMPGMNGIELIRNLQQAQPNVPAILITGHSLKFGEEEMKRLPALKTVLNKPFGWRRLADLLIQHWPDDNPPKIKDLG